MAADTQAAEQVVSTSIEWLTRFGGTDLEDLCRATEAAIQDGNGFGWLRVPPRDKLESYWRGVLLVPDRQLVVARLDGTVVGSAQLVRPPANNEAQAFAAMVTTFFVAPWARGHGLARELTLAVESYARREGFKVLNLDVRETQSAAIKLYESLNYARWGKNPKYALVEGKMITGHHYYKELK